ncbi:MAG: hypothetical protein HQK91_07870 [Nitrospirae bacterium]|nr:hypothetical protein [Nitrospirota bacterium]
MKETISEFIKRILTNNKTKNDNLIESSNKVFGMWKDRDFNTDNYIRALRKGKRLDYLSI